MMPDETRQVRPDELRARLFRALRSLERGLIAIDDGDASGYDDALRAIRLLALSGRGNGLLLRVAAQDSIELPKICITPPAESVPDAEEPLVFAMGAIPAEGVPRPSDPRWPEQLVSLTELLHQRVLYLDGSIAPRELGGSARLSWEELLVLLANKMGASHVDDKVPLVFDEICRYCFVDGIHPLAFAVRSFGVVCSPPTRERGFFPTWWREFFGPTIDGGHRAHLDRGTPLVWPHRRYGQHPDQRCLEGRNKPQR